MSGDPDAGAGTDADIERDASRGDDAHRAQHGDDGVKAAADQVTYSGFWPARLRRQNLPRPSSSPHPAVALESFQHLLSQFPQSEKAPDALLKVGYSQLELKQDAKARATLAAVVSKYPGSRAASLAQERLQRLPRASN